MPKVSVIIPCYNQGHFIDEAVDSVIAQTFQDFEIIIINDGSTDRFTLEKLKNFDKPKTKVLHTSNQGLASARNNGINTALGEYILPLDADDRIAPNYLKDALSVFDAGKNIKVVYGRAEFFGNENGEWIIPEYNMPLMLKKNLIFCSALFRKKDFIRVGRYNSNMIHGWEDWDLWLRLICNEEEVVKLNKTVFYYRIHDTNSMVNKIESDTVKRYYLEQQLIRNNLDLYLKYFPDPIRILREFDWMEEQFNNFEKVKKQIYCSLSYRLGNFLLKPLKLLKKFFTKTP